MQMLQQVDFSAHVQPEWNTLADEAILDVRFAISKAKVHLADPAHYPVATGTDSLEALLVDAAKELKDRTRLQQLKNEGLALSQMPLEQWLHYPSVSSREIDFQSAVSIMDQIGKASNRCLSDPRTEVKYHTLSGETPLVTSTLEWRLNRVKCVEETGLTDWGQDKLFVGGTTIDAFGNASVGGVLDLGSWSNNEDLPVIRTLAVNNLSNGVGWPRTYYYIVNISVRGSDKLYDFLNKVVQHLRDYAVTYLSSAAAAYVGFEIGMAVGSLGGPLGAAAGALVGALVGYLMGKLIDAVWDEIKGFFTGETKLFKPVTLQIDLPRQGATFIDDALASNMLPVTFPGHGGKFRLDINGILKWIPQLQPSAIARMPDHLDLATTRSYHGFHVKTWSNETNFQWSDPVTLTEPYLSPDSPITLVSSMPWRLDVVSVDRDGQASVVGRTWKIGQQTHWHVEKLPRISAGLICGSTISAVSRGNNMLDLFATAKDGKVYSAAQEAGDPGLWKGWWRITADNGAFLPGTPIAAVSRSTGRLDVFALGLDGRCWSAAYGPDGTGHWKWTGWFPILNNKFVPGAHVTAVSRQSDQIDLFAVTIDGEVRTAAWSPTTNNGQWGGWWRITDDSGTFAPGTPIAAVHRAENYLDLFAIGLDGRVWTAAWGPHTNHQWKGWTSISQARFLQGSVISATSRGVNNIDLFIGGLDGNIWTLAWDGRWKEFTIQP